MGRRLIPTGMVRASRPLRTTLRRARWLWRMRRRFRRQEPVTLNDKILYRMAFDRRPLLTTLADKWAVRQYVADRVGPEVLTAVHRVLEPGERLDPATLPERCAIKPTHGSGAVILVDDRAPVDAALPWPSAPREWTSVTARVRREALTTGAFEALVAVWFASTYSPTRERFYRAIPPRLLVEELLDDGTGTTPADYKLWCFGGRVGFIQIDLDRFTDHRQSLVSTEWDPIPAHISAPRPEFPPRRARELARLVAAAEALATSLDFVRVDLYAVGGRVKFGEMTNTPLGGSAPMSPESVLAEFGAEWLPHHAYGPWRGRRLLRP